MGVGCKLEFVLFAHTPWEDLHAEEEEPRGRGLRAQGRGQLEANPPRGAAERAPEEIAPVRVAGVLWPSLGRLNPPVRGGGAGAGRDRRRMGRRQRPSPRPVWVGCSSGAAGWS